MDRETFENQAPAGIAIDEAIMLVQLLGAHAHDAHLSREDRKRLADNLREVADKLSLGPEEAHHGRKPASRLQHVEIVPPARILPEDMKSLYVRFKPWPWPPKTSDKDDKGKK